MKNICILLFSMLPISAFCQKMPDYGLNRIRIAQPDKIVVASIEPVSSNPSIKQTLVYYWYSAGAVHSTQGGYSGKLLNGMYTEYYPDKNLKEQGVFKKGLKDGVWKNWKDDGALIAATIWKSGIVVTGENPPIWKRIHPFRKKPKAPDSLKAVKN